MTTVAKLVAALTAAGAPADMVERARSGYYHDYLSPLPAPIIQLVIDSRLAGLHGIATRAIDGEFDATKEESDEWAASPEGQAAFRALLGRD